jgi:hypothetical protein
MVEGNSITKERYGVLPRVGITYVYTVAKQTMPSKIALRRLASHLVTRPIRRKIHFRPTILQLLLLWNHPTRSFCTVQFSFYTRDVSRYS